MFTLGFEPTVFEIVERERETQLRPKGCYLRLEGSHQCLLLSNDT